MKKNITLLILLIAFLFALVGSYSQMFVAILLMLTFYKGCREKYFYNPYYMIITTMVSYLLYYQPFGGFFFADLSFQTQSLIFLCLLAVFLGFICSSRINIKPVMTGEYSENFFIAFILGLMPTLVSVYMFGNTLDMSGGELLETKEKMIIPFIGQFAYWLPASIIIACKKNKSKWILLSLVASLIVALMSVTKTGMLIAIMFFVIGMSAYTPSLSRHKTILKMKKYALVWLPIALIFFFIYNNNIRHEAGSSNDMAYVEQSNSQIWSTDDLGQGFFLNYLYFCSPWSNLDYNISLQKETGYGVNTFAQFAHLLRLPEYRIEKLNPTFLNTHTFITDYYIDFGFGGAVIASFLLGIFIYYCYRKFGCSDDPLLLSFYILIAYATFMMFFSNHFNNGYLLNYFITFVGYSFIFRKRKYNAKNNGNNSHVR